MAVISPNMNLPIPSVGVTEGPIYADNVNTCLSLVDLHDHTPGAGAQVTPVGLNINVDLSMQGNSLSNTKSVALLTQLAAPSPGSIYQVGNDLYWSNTGGAVQITSGLSVAGSSGTITGLPSGTASANYISPTFIFQAATNVAANVDVQSVILRKGTASSPGVTLGVPNSLSVPYTLTVPATPPASSSFMVLDASGNMTSPIATFEGISTNNIGNSQVTSAKLGPNSVIDGKLATNSVNRLDIKPLAVDGGGATGRIAQNTITDYNIAPLAIKTAAIDNLAVTSGKIANFNVGPTQLADNSVSNVKIQNGAVTQDKLGAANFTYAGPYSGGGSNVIDSGALLTVVITSTGRPVVCAVIASNGDGPGFMSLAAGGGSHLAQAFFRILRDGTALSRNSLQLNYDGTGSNALSVPLGFQIFDVVGPGTHTYQLSANVSWGGDGWGLTGAVMIAYEI